MERRLTPGLMTRPEASMESCTTVVTDALPTNTIRSSRFAISLLHPGAADVIVDPSILDDRVVIRSIRAGRRTQRQERT